eukprot:TRINITY_DN52404_c0_g1_i1.p1 TRINITY_DN52404_c0_g1~~TRINITY_DN52404_c0_g1_i1.p1  ORF type:complete len:195 (+),score=25.01 TRINITY_DN52404_c0_g1_i1:106-690(+)
MWPCQRFVVLLALLSMQPVDSVSRSQAGAKFLARMRTRTRGIIQMYDRIHSDPECDCACCVVEGRRPTEMSENIVSKCGVPPPMSSVGQNEADCSSRCSVVNDPVLTSVSVVAMERFCFYRCQPSSDQRPSEKSRLKHADDASFNGGALVDSPCVPIPETLQAHAEDTDGNGRDPMLQATVPTKGAMIGDPPSR